MTEDRQTATSAVLAAIEQLTNHDKISQGDKSGYPEASDIAAEAKISLVRVRPLLTDMFRQGLVDRIAVEKKIGRKSKTGKASILVRSVNRYFIK